MRCYHILKPPWALAILFAWAVLVAPALAIDSTWNADADGNWSDAAKWTAGIPNAIDDIARLTLTTAAPRTITIDSAISGGVTLGKLYLRDATVAAAVGQSLKLDVPSGQPSGSVLIQCDGATPTWPVISAPLVLNHTPYFVVKGNGLSVTGVISSGVANTGILKSGPGILELSAANTYSWNTTIADGVVRAKDGVGLPAASNLSLAYPFVSGCGGILESIGPTTFTRSLGWGSGQVQWENGGGFSARGGKMTVAIGGTASPTPLIWGSGYFVPPNYRLAFGSLTSDSETEFRNNIDLAGDHTIRVHDNPTTAADFATMSGILSNGGLTKDGPGTLVLTGANTYTGRTVVLTGTLRAQDGVGLPTASNLYIGGQGSDRPVLESSGVFARSTGQGAGQFELSYSGGFAAKGGKLTVAIGGTANPTQLSWYSRFLAQPQGALVLSSPTADSETEWVNNIYVNPAYGAATIYVHDNPSTNTDFATFSGVLSGTGSGLTKDGPGTLVLSGANTYTGPTTVAAGVLRASDGVGPPSASNLVLSGGVLEGVGVTTFSRTLGTSGTNTVQWTGGGGFTARGGKMTVAIGGTGSPTALTWGSGYFVPSGSALIFGSTTADSETEFRNNINLAGGARTVTVNDNPATAADFATLSGVLSNGGLVKNGSGVLALSGANTYAGNTTIKAGALRDTSGTGLPTASNLELAGGVLEGLGATTFARTLGATGANTIQWTGSGGFTASGGKMTVAIGGTVSPTPLTWGAGNFVPAGSALVFGSMISNSETELRNAIDLAGAARTVTVNDNTSTGADFATISGALSNGGLVKDGPGTLVLSGANNLTGGVTLGAGTLRLAGAAALASGNAVTVQGGSTLDIGTYNTNVGTVTLADGTIIGTGGLLNGSGYDVRKGTISVPLTGNGALTKTTADIVSLAATNTFTGPTTVSGGTLRLGASNALPDGSNITVQGGSTLDIGTYGSSPATVTLADGMIAGTTGVLTGSGYDVRKGTISAMLGGTGALTKTTADTVTLAAANNFTGPTTVSDGTLRLGASNALPGGSNVTVQGGSTLDIGTYGSSPATVTLADGTIAGTTGVLTGLGYDVRKGTITAKLGGTAGLTKATTDTVTLAGADSYTGATTISGGMLRATSGAGLPAASNLILNGGVLVGVGVTTFSRTLGTSGTNTVQWTSSGGFSASGGKMTVAIGGTASPTALTWASGNFVPAGSALVLGSSTADSETEFKNSINMAGASRTVTVNDNPSSGADFARISGTLSNGGLVKDGSGVLVLSGANTYTGATTVMSGALHATSGAGLPTASNLILSGGVLEGGGVTTFSRTLGTSGTNTVQWTSSGGFSASGGKMTVAIGGTSSPTALTWGSGNFVPAGSALVFVSSTADGETEFRNSINLAGAARTVTVNDNTLSAADFATLSGALSNGGLVKDGPGALALSGSNDLTGGATVSVGTLRLAGAAALASGNAVTVQGGSTLDIGTYNTNVGTVTLADGTITGTTGILTGSGYDMRKGTVNTTLGGSVALAKTTPDTVTLAGANTYTGVTTVSGGSLRATSGAGLPAASNLTLKGGVLEGIGATTFTRNMGASGTNKVEWTGSGGFSASGGKMTVAIGGTAHPATLIWNASNFVPSGSALILNSLTADNEIDFTNPIYLGGANRTFTVNDNPATAADFATISGTLSNGALKKDGPGMLVLKGSHTYTGATTVAAGTLKLAAGAVLASTTFDVGSAASLDLRDLVGGLTLGAGKSLKGGGRVLGDLVVGGTLSPGESPGILSVDDITFAAGSTLNMELGGKVRGGGGYDALVSSGGVVLQDGSRLSVSLISSFVPEMGDEFDILDFSSLSGRFTTINLPPLAGGLSGARTSFISTAR